MTDTQMLVLIGTIWVAPHSNVWYALFVGSIISIIAICKALEWL
jgi:hypothetical protein